MRSFLNLIWSSSCTNEGAASTSPGGANRECQRLQQIGSLRPQRGDYMAQESSKRSFGKSSMSSHGRLPLHLKPRSLVDGNKLRLLLDKLPTALHLLCESQVGHSPLPSLRNVRSSQAVDSICKPISGATALWKST